MHLKTDIIVFLGLLIPKILQIVFPSLKSIVIWIDFFFKKINTHVCILLSLMVVCYHFSKKKLPLPFCAVL